MEEITEEKNKRFFNQIQKWNELCKANPTMLISPTFSCDNASIIEEFSTISENITNYMKSMNGWLMNHKISETLQLMPTIGKLLSQLCKLPIVQVNDELSSVVLDCIMNLSNLMSSIPVDDSNTNTYKRAKSWALDHMSTLTSIQVDGLDKFLMEEFGVSHREYMVEHLKQMTYVIKELIPHCPYNNSNEDTTELPKLIFAITDMLDDANMSRVLESLISQLQIHSMKPTQVIDKLTERVIDSAFLYSEITINSLHYLFSLNYSGFEDLIITIIEYLTTLYPAVDEYLVLGSLRRTRLLELCSYNEKYFLGAIQIIKETIFIVGVHPALTCLLQVMNRFHQSMLDFPLITWEEILDSILRKKSSFASSIINSHEPFQIPKQVEDNMNSLNDESTRSLYYTCWFKLVENPEMINKSLVLMLFSKDATLLQTSLNVILIYLYPKYACQLYSEMTKVTLYLKSLRQIVSKKYVETSDLLYLSSTLKSNLLHVVDLSLFTLIITVIFLLQSNGGALIAEEVITSLSKHLKQDDVMYWLLFCVEAVLESNLKLQNNTNLKIFRQIIENMYKRKLDGEKPYESDNNNCVLLCKKFGLAETTVETSFAQCWKRTLKRFPNDIE